MTLAGHDLDTALGRLAGWPVAHAAAAVRTGEVVATAGPGDRRFALASVTKLLTALTVLIAVEEGTLALADDAGPPGSTIAHLLAHASGLSMADRTTVLAAPGTRRIYSNAGFEVLADRLAERSGLPFDRYLAEAVLEPLGMADTTLDGSPAAGATSTAADLTRLASELAHPTLLAPETWAQATRVAFPGLSGVLPGFGRQSPNDWGLGVELKAAKRPHWTGHGNSPATFGHFGQTGTFLWVDPDADVATVVLTDRRFGSWAAEAWPDLSDAVLVAAAAGP